MDYLIRGIASNNQIRFFATSCTQSVQHVVDIHHLSTTNSFFLGRLISAGYLMAATLKNYNDSVTIKIHSDGPLKGAIIVAKGDHTIKGYVFNPEYEMSMNNNDTSLKLGREVGSGILTIIKDLQLDHPYSGQIELVSGEIAEDIAYYYAISEQTPTTLNLGLLCEPNGKIRTAGGFLIQLLPDTPDDIITQLENNLSSFPNLSDMLDMGHSIEHIIENFILKGFDSEITERYPISYHCDCSKDRFKNGIRLLDNVELTEIIEANETINTECHFCNNQYPFTIGEIKDILLEKQK